MTQLNAEWKRGWYTLNMMVISWFTKAQPPIAAVFSECSN
jgi:hypothetical protein